MSKRRVRWNGARLCQKNSRMDSQNLNGTIHYWECNMGLLVWPQYKSAMVCLGAAWVGTGSTGKRMAASCFTICGHFGHCAPWRWVYWHHFWGVQAPVLACSRCLRSCARAIQRYGYSRMLHHDSALQHCLCRSWCFGSGRCTAHALYLHSPCDFLFLCTKKRLWGATIPRVLQGNWGYRQIHMGTGVNELIFKEWLSQYVVLGGGLQKAEIAGWSVSFVGQEILHTITLSKLCVASQSCCIFLKIFCWKIHNNNNNNKKGGGGGSLLDVKQ